MRFGTRRRQLQPPQPEYLRRTTDPSESMRAFFAYLHDHEATTDLAKTLADVAMLRMTGARPLRAPAPERLAS